jgi:hypothetical protein
MPKLKIARMTFFQRVQLNLNHGDDAEREAKIGRHE